MKYPKFLERALGTILMITPTTVLARVNIYPTTQGRGTPLTLGGVVLLVSDALTMLLGLLLTITIAIIVYGGFKMAWSKGVDTEYKKGKDIIYNAAIGLAVILGTGIIVATISRFAVNPDNIL